MARFVRYPNVQNVELNELVRVLSEADETVPGVYINLDSPYQQTSVATTITAASISSAYSLPVITPNLDATTKVLWTLIRNLKESGIIR